MAKRVLIVEDSSVMRKLLGFAVKNMPNMQPAIEIDEATDGVAALKAIRGADQPYDLVLLDLNLPVMDGMKLLGYLRDEPVAGAPVIAVVTTEGAEDTEKQARSLGARYFLRKPVTRRDVEQVLHEVLD